jgi:hypothetical protein
MCVCAEDRRCDMGVSEGISEGDRALARPDVDRMLAARANVDKGTIMSKAIDVSTKNNRNAQTWHQLGE